MTFTALATELKLAMFDSIDKRSTIIAQNETPSLI